MNLKANSFTDELSSYVGLDKEYAHNVINHMEKYVRGNVHTNGIENFWSLLIRGTYVRVEPFHLFRYVDFCPHAKPKIRRSPFEQFEALTRRLLAVPRKELQGKLDKYEGEKAKRRKQL